MDVYGYGNVWIYGHMDPTDGAIHAWDQIQVQTPKYQASQNTSGWLKTEDVITLLHKWTS